MMKKLTAFLLALLLTASGTLAFAEESGITWTEEDRARLRVGNPTPLRGRFFTTMWGGTTSDLDVQDLLHGYSPVLYDVELSRFRFDRSVLEDAVAMDDADGNRTYMLVFYDDLYWSDGTPITALDYAFSILFAMDPVIAETGGRPADYSWIFGAEAYLKHESETLSGLRVVTDRILQIRVRADALPYFYELSRLRIFPYPAGIIAPGISVRDDGDGAYLSGPLTAEMIERTVLDPGTGYLSHPSVVSGPYTLTGYEWPTAHFAINPYYKGNEKGFIPRIGELEYTLVNDGKGMMDAFMQGEYGLLNKVTASESIRAGIGNQESLGHTYDMESYARTGLTMIWFMESSPLVQDPEVRKAIACCFDRDGFIMEAVGSYGLRADGLYGLGQWPFRLGTGQMGAPVNENLPAAEQQAEEEAFEALSLDGLTVWPFDPAEAARLLENAGWKKNGQGIRARKTDGGTAELRLVLGVPDASGAEAALESHFVRNLEEAGIAVTIRLMPMDEIEKAYRGESDSADMLYLGENFSILLNPGILAPTSGTEYPSIRGSLPEVKAELFGMAEDVIRTEPTDVLGYMRKWTALQIRISETLPLLPVYTNVYFDFYSRELHNYRISGAVTWGEAIVESYISDAEDPAETLE